MPKPLTAAQPLPAGASDMPDPLRGLRIKDQHLEDVLRGKAFLLQDGAMGSMLQQRGLALDGQVPDLLNLTHAQDITAIHAEYVAAGAQMVTTNTFGANQRKLEGAATVEEVYQAAADNARAAGARYVAGDVGPTGALLQPLGTMTFDQAYDLFAQQMRAIVAAGCDLVAIETMTDLREAKAAVLAAHDCTDLPIIATMTFGEDGRTFLGTPPAIAAQVLSSLGAHIVGVNCSLGPNELLPLVDQLVECSRCPVVVRPNAGLPRMQDGQTVYDVLPDSFAATMRDIIAKGVTVVGGCCGTTPAHIAALAQVVGQGEPAPRPYRAAFAVASAQQMVELRPGQRRVAVIGERINPTGKPKLKAALRAADYDYVVGEAEAQLQAGADILDVNVGLPDLDEPAVLAQVAEQLMATVTAPLQIDSSDPAAIQAAVRTYAGKPLINSVNGKQENLDAVLPLVKRYGCSVVGLTLDEGGIPPTAEGRFAIAQRIVDEAHRYGIPTCDIAIDCLVMAAATNQREACEILRAVTMVKERLGVRTVLGVSNISFGLPHRGLMNATFLAAALGAGLDLPILNPLSQRYVDVIASFKVLNAEDEQAHGYIERYANVMDAPAAAAPAQGATAGAQADGHGAASSAALPEDAIAIPPELAPLEPQVRQVERLIMAGRKGSMPAAVEGLLQGVPPLAVINQVLIPVLDAVGMRFDRGQFFLPQLMASAEAVKAGFDVVRQRVASQTGEAGAAAQESRGVILATVKGDIHDIGKNIVRMLLENYGFTVVDLGRDVPPETVLQAAQDTGIRLIGLSALMTTTVKAMEQTIKLLHQEMPDAKVFVGGAVLTPDYAQTIGADFYSKDAAESARIAERFYA